MSKTYEDIARDVMQECAFERQLIKELIAARKRIEELEALIIEVSHQRDKAVELACMFIEE
jgi:hypothetical protein